MRRALVLFALAVGVGVPGRAQIPPPPPAPPPPPPVAADSVVPFAKAPHMLPQEFADGSGEWSDVPLATDTMAPRALPEDVLTRYRTDPAFQYYNPRAERPSVFARLVDWIARTIFEPVGQSLGPNGVRLLILGLAALLLGWAVTWLLRLGGGSPFSRRETTAQEAPLLDVEDIAEVDLARLLTGAMQREDYREAVRWRYLLALQALDAAGVIRWSRHKTNREYLREAEAAGDPHRAAAFAEATRSFEWVWYGQRPVDRARHDALAPVFGSLQRDRQPAVTT